MLSKNLQRSRELRANSTIAERQLWRLLRSRTLADYKFYRQYSIGPFIVDFCCRTAKVVVEIDGSQHTDEKQYDESRTRFLEGLGYTVLRFWNDDVFLRLGSVLEAIFEALERRPHPPFGHPLPEGRGGSA